MKSFQCSSKGKMIQPGTLLCGLCLISGEQTLGLEGKGGGWAGRGSVSWRPCTFLSSDQCPWRHPCPAIPHQGREQVILHSLWFCFQWHHLGSFLSSEQHKGYVLCEFQASLLTPDGREARKLRNWVQVRSQIRSHLLLLSWLRPSIRRHFMGSYCLPSIYRSLSSLSQILDFVCFWCHIHHRAVYFREAVGFVKDIIKW